MSEALNRLNNTLEKTCLNLWLYLCLCRTFITLKGYFQMTLNSAIPKYCSGWGYECHIEQSQFVILIWIKYFPFFIQINYL